MTAVILRELSLFFWLNHSLELPPRTLFVIRLQPFSIFAQVARPEDGPLQTSAKHHFSLAIFGISVQNRPESIRGRLEFALLPQSITDIEVIHRVRRIAFQSVT